MPKLPGIWMKAALRRFGRVRRGATAVEFALLATPFLLLTMGGIELSIIHLTRSSVTAAMQQASRQVLTGVAGCVTADEYKRAICSAVAMSPMAQCMANTKVIMQELADFSVSAPTAQTDFAAIRDSVDPGSSESVMFVRVYHRWKVILPMLDEVLSGGNGEVVMTSSMAFKNEPFEGAAGCSS